MDPHTFIFKRIAGWNLRVDVYRPSGGGVLPVVVWIHGGALIMGGRLSVFMVRCPDERCCPVTFVPRPTWASE